MAHEITAEDLLHWRQAHDWSQARAAAEAGYSLRHYIRMEKGEVPVARPLAQRLRAELD